MSTTILSTELKNAICKFRIFIIKKYFMSIKYSNMTYIEKNLRLCNIIPIKSSLSKKGDLLTLHLNYRTSNYKILDEKLFHTNAIVINTSTTQIKNKYNSILLADSFNIIKYDISYKTYMYNNTVYIVVYHNLEICMSYLNLMNNIIIAKNLLNLKNNV
jgi:hypothetical protein